MKTTKGKPIILFLGVYIHLLEQNGAHINKLPASINNDTNENIKHKNRKFSFHRDKCI